MAKKKITKAVIPAAGFGTRFLPQTKAMPKEMLPIVDKPVIQYVVEEAVASGIEDIVMVTGWHKRAVEDHFDYPFELEIRLEEWGKEDKLKEVRRIAEMANFIYVRQKGPYGNATPVLSAQKVIDGDPFVVLWGDEFILSDPPRTKQCIEVFEKYGDPVISGIKVEDVTRYGIAKVKHIEKNVYQLFDLVEKPTVKEAPSNLAAHGCYVLTPDIFPALKSLKPGKGGELWLVDGIRELMKSRPVYVCEIEGGRYYDTGNKLEYLKTVIELALTHKEVGQDLKKYLKGLKI